MSKKLKYVPIYDGEFNMTRERKAQIDAARAYSKKVNRRRNFWIEVRNNLIMMIIFLLVYGGLFFTLLFM